MRIILNVSKDSKYGSFYADSQIVCTTIDTFAEIMAYNPEDTFIIEGVESINAWHKFQSFLDLMGWNIEDWVVTTNYLHDLPLMIQEEADERFYEDCMAEELEWYNHARQMGWE